MTSSVIIIHTGGNKAIDVIVEKPGVSDNGGEEWDDTSRFTLWQGGQVTPQYYVTDDQRLRIEEVGGFKKSADEKFNNLVAAVKHLYYSANWSADRPVDEANLWEAVRDAAELTPGESATKVGKP